MSPDRVELDADELAGIVGLFGGLTRQELRRACNELRFKVGGSDVAPPDLDERIDAALAEYRLYETEDDVLIPGPTAFPELPEFAEDLPHLLDVNAREVDREAAARELVETLAAERAGDVDAERAETIAQLSYDIEAWADVDASALRPEPEA